LADDEKSQVIADAPLSYWNFLNASLAAASQGAISRETHLMDPFTFKYYIPHNQAIEGACHEHACISTNLPDATIGQPDACLKLADKVVGIVKIKTFWNVTEQAVVEVLRGSPLTAVANHRTRAIIRRSSRATRS